MEKKETGKGEISVQCHNHRQGPREKGSGPQFCRSVVMFSGTIGGRKLVRKVNRFEVINIHGRGSSAPGTDVIREGMG